MMEKVRARQMSKFEAVICFLSSSLDILTSDLCQILNNEKPNNVTFYFRRTAQDLSWCLVQPMVWSLRKKAG